MPQKEYEMPESYKRALADYTEFLAQRDALSEAIKFAEPGGKQEGLELLRDFDKKLESAEAALAEEYKQTQELLAALDKRRQSVLQMAETARLLIPEFENLGDTAAADLARKVYEDSLRLAEVPLLEQLETLNREQQSGTP